MTSGLILGIDEDFDVYLGGVLSYQVSQVFGEAVLVAKGVLAALVIVSAPSKMPGGEGGGREPWFSCGGCGGSMGDVP